MSPLFEAAREVHAFFRRRKWQFCIIGGLALQRWGEHRATIDVDLVLLTGYGNERKFVDALLGRFGARIADARDFALANRVVLCQASNGVGIDISLGGLPFEERVIERASVHTFGPRLKWVTASAEDLVVLKAFADRPQDWIDVRGILRRQWPRLDWDCIVQELDDLLALKEDWGVMRHLEKARRQVEEELTG